MERDIKKFEDLKDGDLVYIGWADEDKGKFGNIRQVPVKKVLYSRSDDYVYLRFAEDDVYDIEFKDSNVWPSHSLGSGLDTTLLETEDVQYSCWIGLTWKEVAEAVLQSASEYVVEKTLQVKRLQEHINDVVEEINKIKHG